MTTEDVGLQLQSLAQRASRLPGALPASPPSTMISFESGHAFPELLPDLHDVAESALAGYREETLQYGPKAGLAELRDWLASYAAEEGMTISPAHVLMTNGAKQAIELICKLLLDEGDSIVVTAPTYFTAIPIFRSFGVRFLEVGQDREGLDVDELAAIIRQERRIGRRPPKFIYNVPEYHNPTGVTMTLARRSALVDLALRERIFIVEDSPYRQIRFEGELTPPLKSLDPAGIVLHVGTFSKLLAPGLRVGWVAASPELISRMVHLKADGGSSPLAQRMVLEFCRAGRLPSHTARVRDAYRIHRDRMVDALRAQLPEVTFQIPSGGYYLWLTLPDDMDGDALTAHAAQTGVTVLGPARCYACPGHATNNVRLAFTHAGLDEINEGVGRLAAAFRSMVPDATARA